MHVDLTLLHSCACVSLVTELLCALDHSSNAFALAQVAPQDKLPFDTVCVCVCVCLCVSVRVRVVRVVQGCVCVRLCAAVCGWCVLCGRYVVGEDSSLLPEPCLRPSHGDRHDGFLHLGGGGAGWSHCVVFFWCCVVYLWLNVRR